MVEVVRVRVARPEDYDRIAAVIDDWWGRPVGASLPRLFLDHFWSTSRVAEDERGLAGFVVAFISPSQPHVGYIHFAGIRPDHRRTGLARRLYEHFADHARGQGCTELCHHWRGQHRLDPSPSGSHVSSLSTGVISHAGADLLIPHPLSDAPEQMERLAAEVVPLLTT